MRRRAILAVTTCLVRLSVAGCAGGAKVREFTLIQTDTQIQVNDLGPKGDSPGDEIDVVAKLSRDGQPAGYLTGYAHISKMPNAGGVDTGDRQVRVTQFSFNLPEGDLMIVGQGLYRVGERRVPVGEPVTRPVVGGTKDYIGARGEVISTWQPDGSHAQQFRLIS